MAQITKRRKGELIRGVFQILLQEPEGMPAKTILSRLVDIVPPTEFELTTYPKNPNERRYEKIVRFATIGPVKAGWLIKDRGQWSLTEEGTKAYERHSNPEEFTRESDRLYGRWKKDKDQAQGEEEIVEDDSQLITTTLEEAEEAAWSEIENHLANMNPYDFQELFAGLLRGMGYHVEWISPPGPDRGIDVIAHADPLGVSGPRIKAQVKRRADRINVDGVRSFMAVLAEGDVGLFVSTGGFTKNAADEARRQEKRKIMLVDLKRLFDLWVEHYEQIPETQRQLLPLRRVYYLAPKE